MSRFTALVAGIAIASSATGLASAQAAHPYAGGDAAAGRALAQKDCNGCHLRKFDGDAARIYTRPDRKVTTPAQLLAQVRYCSTELSLQYFPDDEASVAAYLDREHYRFSK
ncbi:MAG: cytochrome c [Betaproteobacteria bacterium]